MPRRPKFTLEFAPETVEQLHSIDRKHHHLVEETIDVQLSHSREEESRNRKPLERPTSIGATWELRFGRNNRFRVFYEVDLVVQKVRILAIGVK